MSPHPPLRGVFNCRADQRPESGPLFGRLACLADEALGEAFDMAHLSEQLAAHARLCQLTIEVGCEHTVPCARAAAVRRRERRGGVASR